MPVVFMLPLAEIVVIPLKAPAELTSKLVELIVRALLPPPMVIAPVPVMECAPLV